MRPQFHDLRLKRFDVLVQLLLLLLLLSLALKMLAA
jgi:hypothetical protein